MASPLKTKQMGTETLTKREVESVYAGIKKFDLKSPALDCAFLADELVQARLPNFASAVGG